MCLANYMNVADPFDVDGNGVFTYAFSQWTTEQLMIYDEHCYIAGTDTNCGQPVRTHPRRSARLGPDL